MNNNNEKALDNQHKLIGITPEDDTLTEEQLLEHIHLNKEKYQEIIEFIKEEIHKYINDSELPAIPEEKSYFELIVSLFDISKEEIDNTKEEVKTEAKKNNISILEQLLRNKQHIELTEDNKNSFVRQVTKLNMIIDLILNHIGMLIKHTEYEYLGENHQDILHLLTKKVIYNLSLYGVDPKAIALSFVYNALPNNMLREITREVTQEEWNTIIESEFVDNLMRAFIKIITKQQTDEVIKWLQEQEEANHSPSKDELIKIIDFILKLAVSWNNQDIIQYVIDILFKINAPENKAISYIFIRGNYETCLKFIQPKMWNKYSNLLKAEIVKLIILRSGDITGAKLLSNLKSNNFLISEIFRDVLEIISEEDELQITKIQEIFLPIMAEDAANQWDSYEDKIGLLKLIILTHRCNQENVILKHLHNEALLNYAHYKAVQQELINIGLKSKTKKLFSKYIKLLKAENNKALYGELYIPGENEENYATGYTKEEFIEAFKASSKKEQSGFITKTAKKIEKTIKNNKLNFKEKSKVIEIKMKKVELLISYKPETKKLKYKTKPKTTYQADVDFLNAMADDLLSGPNSNELAIFRQEHIQEFIESETLSCEEKVIILKTKMEEVKHLLCPDKINSRAKGNFKDISSPKESLMPEESKELLAELKETVTQFHYEALLEEGNEGLAATHQPKTKPKKKPPQKNNKDKKEAEPKDESKKGKVVSVEVNPNDGGIEIATSSGNKHLTIEPDEATIREEAIRQERFIAQQFLIEKKIEEQRLKESKDKPTDNDPLDEKLPPKKKKNKSSSKNKKGTREKVQEKLPTTDSVTTTVIEEKTDIIYKEVALQPKPSPKKKDPLQEKEEMAKVQKLLWPLPEQNNNEQKTPAETVAKEEVKLKAKQDTANSKNKKATALKKILKIPEQVSKEQESSRETVDLEEDRPNENQLPEKVDTQNQESAVTKIETKEEDNSERSIEKQELTLPSQNQEQQHPINQQKFILQKCNTYYINSQGEQIEAFTLPNAHLAINQYGEQISISNLQLYKLDPSQAMTLQIPCNNFCYNQNNDKVEVFTLPGASCGIDQYGNQFSINSGAHNSMPPAPQVVVVERIVYVPVPGAIYPSTAPGLNNTMYPTYSTGGYNMQIANSGGNYPGGGGSGVRAKKYAKNHNDIQSESTNQETPAEIAILLDTSAIQNKKILSSEGQEFEESIQIVNERWNNQEKLLIEIDNHHQFEITKPYNASYVPVDIEDNLIPRSPLFFEDGIKFAGAEEGINLMPIM